MLILADLEVSAQTPTPSPCLLKQCRCTSNATTEVWKTVPSLGYTKMYSRATATWYNQYSSRCSYYNEGLSSVPLRDSRGAQIGVVKYSLKCIDGPPRCGRYDKTKLCKGIISGSSGMFPNNSVRPEVTTQDFGVAPVTAPGECSDFNSSTYGEFGGYSTDNKWGEGWYGSSTIFSFVGYE